MCGDAGVLQQKKVYLFFCTFCRRKKIAPTFWIPLICLNSTQQFFKPLALSQMLNTFLCIVDCGASACEVIYYLSFSCLISNYPLCGTVYLVGWPEIWPSQLELFNLDHHMSKCTCHPHFASITKLSVYTYFNLQHLFVCSLLWSLIFQSSQVFSLFHTCPLGGNRKIESNWLHT